MPLSAGKGAIISRTMTRCSIILYCIKLSIHSKRCCRPFDAFYTPRLVNLITSAAIGIPYPADALLSCGSCGSKARDESEYTDER